MGKTYQPPVPMMAVQSEARRPVTSLRTIPRSPSSSSPSAESAARVDWQHSCTPVVLLAVEQVLAGEPEEPSGVGVPSTRVVRAAATKANLNCIMGG